MKLDIATDADIGKKWWRRVYAYSYTILVREGNGSTYYSGLMWLNFKIKKPSDFSKIIERVKERYELDEKEWSFISLSRIN